MNKVVVITGASSGIGEETAKLLASSGATVILAARREEKLKSIVDGITKSGFKADYKVTDVTKQPEVEDLAKYVIDKYQRIDVWINNAGIMPLAYLKEKDVKDWDQTIDINFKGTVYGVGAALPYMTKANSGQIINISSVYGHVVVPGAAVYAGTKFAVKALTESLRQELANDKLNIRATIISPGLINTELINSITDEDMRKDSANIYKAFGISPKTIAWTIKQAIDLPEEATWNEVIIRPTKQIV